MFKLLFFWFYLHSLGAPNTQTGIASTFYPKERWNNGNLACAGRSNNLQPRVHWSTWKDPEMPVCASRNIPCGTWVYVVNTENDKGAYCIVSDRGPYGAVVSDADITEDIKCYRLENDKCWYVKTQRKQPGVWRGIIDLGPSVANAIESDGWVEVTLHWWPLYDTPYHIHSVTVLLNNWLHERFGH